jgi:hypothetical protein
MPNHERRAEVTVALAFLLVATPRAVWLPGYGSNSAGVALLFAALYAITSRIELDIGSGYGVPTQLVLIPMLFALPPGWVPLLVAAAWVLGKSPSSSEALAHRTGSSAPWPTYRVRPSGTRDPRVTSPSGSSVRSTLRPGGCQ